MTLATGVSIVGYIILVYKQRKRIKGYILYFKNGKKNKEVNRLIRGLGEQYRFNRVSVTEYNDYDEIPITYGDFKKLKLTITHEWCDVQTRSVMAEFRNYSCINFAGALYALNESETGWIRLNEKSKDTGMQNLWGVVDSYRFRMGAFVIDGTIALSWMSRDNVRELNDEELHHIRDVALRIQMLKK